MNVLINTPLLKSSSLKTEFDNKVLVIFLSLIIILVVLSLMFIDLMKTSYSPNPINEENPEEPSQTTVIST